MGLPTDAPTPTRGHATAVIESDDDRFEDGLAALGVTIGAGARRSLIEYLRLLAKWNAVYNLTAIRDARDMLPVHLLDSLAILPLIDECGGSSLLDVGSGAGLPGIPLAITRPRMGVTTVDAVAKKISFQRQVKAQLALTNLTPTHARVEALALAATPSIIVSRAYATIAKTLQSIHHLTDESTHVIAMKGATPQEEIAALPAEWRVDEVRELIVPHLGAHRCAVVLSRA